MLNTRRLVGAGLVLCACLALLVVDYASRPMAAELVQAQQQQWANQLQGGVPQFAQAQQRGMLQWAGQQGGVAGWAQQGAQEWAGQGGQAEELPAWFAQPQPQGALGYFHGGVSAQPHGGFALPQEQEAQGARRYFRGRGPLQDVRPQGLRGMNLAGMSQQRDLRPQGLWGKNLPGVSQPAWREEEVEEEAEEEEEEEAVEETEEERQAREHVEEVAYARSAARARARAAPWYVHAWESARQASYDSMRAAAREAQAQHDREAALNATNGTAVEEEEGDGERKEAGQFDFAHAPWSSWFKIKAEAPAPWETMRAAALEPGRWDWMNFWPVSQHAEDVNGTNASNETDLNGTDVVGEDEGEDDDGDGEDNGENLEGGAEGADMAGGAGGEPSDNAMEQAMKAQWAQQVNPKP